MKNKESVLSTVNGKKLYVIEKCWKSTLSPVSHERLCVIGESEKLFYPWWIETESTLSTVNGKKICVIDGGNERVRNQPIDPRQVTCSLAMLNSKKTKLSTGEIRKVRYLFYRQLVVNKDQATDVISTLCCSNLHHQW